MDRLTLFETFVAALDEGSLNRAARRRRLTQSAVSQQIAQLEAQLGQQLLLRSPRGVRATRAGDLVASHARGLLSGYDKMRAELQALDNSISGTFRVSVSAFLGRLVVGPALIEIDKRYPELDIVMRLEDRFVDVVRENYDLAIRSGTLGDTEGYGRKIASLDTVLVATPDYLDRHGRPKHPSELNRLKLIQRREEQCNGFLTLWRDGQPHQAPARIGFTADDPDLVLQAVANGAGYTKAPRALLQPALDKRQLEQVLPDYTPEKKEIFAVFPSRHRAGRQLDIVIDAVRHGLHALPQLQDATPPSAGFWQPADALPRQVSSPPSPRPQKTKFGAGHPPEKKQ